MMDSIDLSAYAGHAAGRSSVTSEAGGSESSRGFRSFFERIGDRERAEFCTQLAVLLRSKVSLQRSLDVLQNQTENARMKRAIQELGSCVQKGSSLAQGLAAQKEVFDTLFVVSAEVGQESGRLAEVFEHLAHHLENLNGLRRKFIQAMTYPILVSAVALLVVIFFLFYIVPTFAEMFRSFQMELPLSTKIVLALSEFLRSYGLALFTAGVFTLMAAWKSLNRPDIRKRLEDRYTAIPFLGEIILKNHIARFCRTLGTLLHADVLLVDALETSKRIMSHRGVQAEIGQIITQVRQGNAVAGPMINSKFFPPMVAQLIAVGEETSELDEMLLKVAEYFEKEIQAKVDALASIAEPILILFLGIIIAAILVSLYLPMFDVANTIG